MRTGFIVSTGCFVNCLRWILPSPSNTLDSMIMIPQFHLKNRLFWFWCFFLLYIYIWYLAFFCINVPYTNRMIIWTRCKYGSVWMNSNHTDPFAVSNVWFYTIAAKKQYLIVIKTAKQNNIKWNAIFIYPVATSHILIDLSRDADKTKSPAGTKATDETLWSWPSIVLKHSNVCVKSHSLIDISALHEATKQRNAYLKNYLW